MLYSSKSTYSFSACLWNSFGILFKADTFSCGCTDHETYFPQGKLRPPLSSLVPASLREPKEIANNYVLIFHAFAAVTLRVLKQTIIVRCTPTANELCTIRPTQFPEKIDGTHLRPSSRKSLILSEI